MRFKRHDLIRMDDIRLSFSVVASGLRRKAGRSGAENVDVDTCTSRSCVRACESKGWGDVLTAIKRCPPRARPQEGWCGRTGPDRSAGDASPSANRVPR